ncbi:MAG: aminotransferase V [Clostridiales bacterium]|nr:aminotransferase V [Clostridiales bacterium]
MKMKQMCEKSEIMNGTERIYLDYSATTPPCEQAVRTFTEACGSVLNANSAHEPGRETAGHILVAGDELLSLLGLEDREVIYTSGATEANNLALKGCFERYYPKGKGHIITDVMEHSSVIAPVSTLMDRGASFDMAPLDGEGRVDIGALRGLIRPDTLMVSVGTVSGETGIRQPVEELGRMLKAEFPGVIFHTDATQAPGKCDTDLADADLISLSAHKFYGIRGIGALIRKRKVTLRPQVQGGASTTLFRSGTPPAELILSMTAALRETLRDRERKYARVRQLNERLRVFLEYFDGVTVNSPANAVPHILNFSVPGIPAEETQRWFDREGIFFSTRTACARSVSYSAAVEALTGSRDAAARSVRVSLSHLTTDAEMERFMEAFRRFMTCGGKDGADYGV